MTEKYLKIQKNPTTKTTQNALKYKAKTLYYLKRKIKKKEILYSQAIVF